MGQARAVKSIAGAAGGLLLSPLGWIRPLARLGGEGSRWLSSRLRQLTKAEGIRFPLPIPPLSAAHSPLQPQQGKGLAGWAFWGAAGTWLGWVGIHRERLPLASGYSPWKECWSVLARHFGWSVAAPTAGSVL